MNILGRLIPGWVIYAVLAAVLAALLGAIGVQTVRLANEQAAHATTRANYEGERTKAAQASQRAEKAERAEETRREQEKANVIELARMESKRVAAARAAADITGRDMLNAARALAARACEASSDPEPGPGSEATATPADLLADVLGSLEEHGRGIAEEADSRRAAGLTCERQYQSLTPATGGLGLRAPTN